tara:strand:- start:180 stop:353 length:174 start_codon:yes stop_codon:yes gene_type:complete
LKKDFLLTKKEGVLNTLKGRGPFKIVYKKKFKSRSEATIREMEIKKLNSKEKNKLIC